MLRHAHGLPLAPLVMYRVARSHTYLSAVNADSDAGMEPTSWLLFKSQYLLTHRVGIPKRQVHHPHRLTTWHLRQRHAITDSSALESSQQQP